MKFSAIASALTLALISQVSMAAPEGTAAQMMDPAKAGDVAKDPKAAVQAMTDMMDPATMMAMMQGGMNPASSPPMRAAPTVWEVATSSTRMFSRTRAFMSMDAPRMAANPLSIM